MSNEFLRARDVSSATNDNHETTTSTLVDVTSPLASWWETPTSEHRTPLPHPFAGDDDGGGYATTLSELLGGGAASDQHVAHLLPSISTGSEGSSSIAEPVQPDRASSDVVSIPVNPKPRQKLDLTPTPKSKPGSIPSNPKPSQKLDLTPTSENVDKGKSTDSQNGAKEERRDSTPASPESVANAAEVVKHSFHWFYDEAEAALDALQGELQETDPPSWSEQIAGFLLKTALAAGSQAAGLYLGAMISGNDVVREFLQNMFAPGIDAGVAAGRAVIRGGNDDKAVETFIASQKEGVRNRGVAAQTHFIDVGRKEIRTVDDVKQVRAGVEPARMKQAARKQKDASRDAWVSSLAQRKYGAVSSTLGPIIANGSLPPWVDAGEVTTNMDTDAQRTRDRRTDWDKMTIPADGPDANEALFGKSPGVLTVIVELPAINRAGGMSGRPNVIFATLNGVGAKIRDQYLQPLSKSHIPRQVVARVEGAPNFTLNLDEKGALASRPANISWLARRATHADPARERFDDEQNYMTGVRLLLEELVPSEIQDKVL